MHQAQQPPLSLARRPILMTTRLFSIAEGPGTRMFFKVQILQGQLHQKLKLGICKGQAARLTGRKYWPEREKQPKQDGRL
mmetsp:Transcript_39772/g.79722  ORF Transcript_39772/g.79722 Transcript_39772/m.79722 type:complete len:80 (+) Transcript_39772:43-282(+)